ncbi:MAG TPA: exodeoxyribonuclease V subunit beta, partial [Rudaea sp.]|uniref:exodeoxyribonuclease V subunit beta n=1 Tax=Rudaea sp. TaxID=2136325 RepID=UPI002F9299C4
AGTGKTYALAGIHARLIVEKKLQVRDILVVTYTRAAADELRKRLRERLTLCTRIAAEPESPADDAEKAEVSFCRKLIAKALEEGEPRELLLRRLRLAALSLDEAQISTVHAFCERALREQAWRAGVQAAEGKLIDIKPMLGTLAADLWRERATGADAQGWYALLTVTKSADGFVDLMQELCDAQSVLEPDVAESAELLRERIAQGDSALRALGEIWREHGPAAMTALIEHARDGHIKLNSYAPEKTAHEARALAEAFASGAQPDRKVLSRYTSAEIKAKQRKQGRSLPPQLFFAAAQTTVAELERADDAQRLLGLLILRDCADELHRRLQRQQRDVGGYTYDDLISRLHESVCGAHGAATAKALAKRFPAALVDECQDSDAHQFEIFFAIYEQRGLLALVGDPKQSIYRFRGSDVHAYLDARARADARHALDRNFRSTPALIGAFNRLYRDAGEAAFDSGEIRYEPVQPGGTARDDDLLIEGVAPVPLCFWQADAASSKADAALTLAAGCAEEIVHLLMLARGGAAQLRRKQDDGSIQHAALRAEDLAVLVARHDEATVMQRALSARGVPSVVVSRASVFASDTARELLNLLRALDSFDPARLRGVLSSRLLGNTQAGIAALRSDATAWHEQAARFAQWRERWREHGVLALVEIVAEESAARLLAHADGERCVTNLLHLAELLQEAERERDGARALIDWLQQRIAYADKEREEEQLRLESDAGRVHIVTVHAAKGLEYPIVFLPFAALRRSPRNVPSYTRFARTQRIVHVCGVGDDGQAKAVERGEAQAEALRLLYVALTRARVRCYVAWGEIGRGEPPAFANLLLAGTDPSKAESSTSASVSARLAELAASVPELIACSPLPVPTSQRLPGPDLTKLAPARQIRERVHEWRRSHSFSGLSAGARETLRGSTDIAGGEDERNVAAAAIDAPTVPTVLRGTRFGTAFHELLEKVDFSAWRDWHAPPPPPTQRELVDRILHRYAFDGIDDKSAARAVFVQLVAATLNAPLPLGARLADLAPTEHRAEMPFHLAMRSADAQSWLARMQADGYVQARSHFALEGNRLAGLMTGVLDLVVLHDARWWVIDYKTNLLGTNAAQDYAPVRLTTAVREGEYDLQYLIYLTALHRWLKMRLGAAYDYERDIGGALYLFVRGLDRGGVNGVHQDKPPAALIEALDEMLAPPVEIAA